MTDFAGSTWNLWNKCHFPPKVLQDQGNPKQVSAKKNPKDSKQMISEMYQTKTYNFNRSHSQF